MDKDNLKQKGAKRRIRNTDDFGRMERASLTSTPVKKCTAEVKMVRKRSTRLYLPPIVLSHDSKENFDILNNDPLKVNNDTGKKSRANSTFSDLKKNNTVTKSSPKYLNSSDVLELSPSLLNAELDDSVFVTSHLEPNITAEVNDIDLNNFIKRTTFELRPSNNGSTTDININNETSNKRDTFELHKSILNESDLPVIDSDINSEHIDSKRKSTRSTTKKRRSKSLDEKKRICLEDVQTPNKSVRFCDDEENVATTFITTPCAKQSKSASKSDDSDFKNNGIWNKKSISFKVPESNEKRHYKVYSKSPFKQKTSNYLDASLDDTFKFNEIIAKDNSTEENLITNQSIIDLVTPPSLSNSVIGTSTNKGRKKWETSLGVSSLNDSMHKIENPTLFSNSPSLAPLIADKSVVNLVSPFSAKNEDKKRNSVRKKWSTSSGISLLNHSRTIDQNILPACNEKESNSPKKEILKKCVNFETQNKISPKNKAPNKTNKSNGAIKKTKLPNFVALHKKQYAKMENIVELTERKRKRAEILLSGKKPGNDLAAKVSKNSKKMLSFTAGPTKSVPKEVSKPSKSQESKIPLKTKLSPRKISSVRQENIKSIVTKSKASKDSLGIRREVVQKVRTNRRFELLMQMRKGKSS